jgi:hypothetical protein
MSLLMALLLVAVPPPPSGKTLPVGAVEILDPIAPAVGRYSQCLQDRMKRRGALPIVHPATYRRDVRASIRACAAVRASAVAEADAVLARSLDYRDPRRRNAAIAHAFDGTDDQQLNRLEIMSAICRERGIEC